MLRMFFAAFMSRFYTIRSLFQTNRYGVLFQAESDPIGIDYVGGESSSAPGAALAGPEFVDDVDAGLL
jgi:hypothetical protein